MYKSTKSGFTLLELLIVIGIIATLSVASVIVLNPAEAMSKSRDAQRISDLNTLKKAIGIYQVSTPNSKLAGADNTGCKGTAFSTTWQLDTDHIYYSYPTDSGTITGKNLDSVTFTTGGPYQVSKANLGKVDSTGWIPINFTTISGGSPISALPIDPVNTIADLANPSNTDLVYRYICTEKNLTYEIHATLESTAYTVTDNKMAKDGGTAPEYYEVGTSLNLLTTEGAGGMTQLAMPVADPVAGTYPNGQALTLSADAGSTIYYTTNGSIPTTSSSVYSSSFTLPFNVITTIKAISVKSGYIDSNVFIAAYNITAVCFLPGTMIKTPDGEIPIEDVLPGQRILAFDNNEQVVPAEITMNRKFERDYYYVIKTESSSVRVSAEHRFYIGNSDFEEVQYLQTGDTIYVLSNNQLKPETIISKERINSHTDVYMLSVTVPNTFFADDFAVHNVKPS